MINNEHINAYKKTQQSSNDVISSHEIVRTLMKELINSMQKMAPPKEFQNHHKIIQTGYSIDRKTIHPASCWETG